MDIPYFNTVFGHNLIGEFVNFVPEPYLVVTMEDLWPLFADKFEDGYQPYFVKSLEEDDLLQDLKGLSKHRAFIGLGGGQAIDVAKYFSWRTGRTLFQCPTSLSVDAVFGHRAGVRRSGNVRYVGWGVPDTVFIDYGVIRAAPRAVNLAGAGDVLCFFTGVLDWRYAHERGVTEAKWPYDQILADQSMARVEALLARQNDVRDLNDHGVRVLVNGHQWGGASFLAAGWNPRHIEGYDHFFFYALEYMTGKKFLHGQPVCLGTYIGAFLHDDRADEVLNAVHNIGVDMRPEAMNVTWDDVGRAMAGLKDYVRENGLWSGIADDAVIDADVISTVRENIEQKYGVWR